MSIKYLEVIAEVRYWEDASINDVEDVDGTLIPLKTGKLWKPIIDLSNGQIQDWPVGTVADIHYKVCDQGEYWLLDENKTRFYKYKSDYVPDDYLSQIDCAYGDYIILKVDKDGFIQKWETPDFEESLWAKL